MKKQIQGFTLIELAIAMVIVAFLVAIAYPSYTQHVMKTRRSDAKISLTELAQLEESHFVDNNTYVHSLSGLLGGETEKYGFRIEGEALISKEGYYQITFGTDQRSNYYQLIAKPYGEGTLDITSPQQDDADCQQFTIDSKGQKTSSPNQKDCW